MNTNNEPSGKPRKPSRKRLWSAVAVLVTLIALLASLLLGRGAQPESISLSKALELISSGSIESALMDDGTNMVSLTEADKDAPSYVAQYPFAFSDELTQLLMDEDIEIDTDATRPSMWSDLAIRMLPILLILGVLVWAVRAASPSKMLGAKGKKALGAGEVPTVTFADVAGADEAVSELSEMVEFLRDPTRFEAVGATTPRGALLAGPPGTGKTLLARAVAGEAQVPFFALAGSDFVETFVGMGARRVRDVFAQARKADRAIIFIDEIDGIGRARSSSPVQGGDSERETTLLSLLNEMDGFVSSHVIVLGATNRAESLDDALTRPGRLDRLIPVPNPDRRGRTAILAVHAKGKPISDDVDLVQVARQTPGMSGADLAQVVNEACLEAARRGRSTVDAECFQSAVATLSMGRARTSALVTDFDRRVTAWHEAGHTLAALLLPDADDPVSVTIVPRGVAGGVTWMSGNDDLFLPRAKAVAQLAVALAGRAAEEVLLDGEFTQGASGDLTTATKLATAMVTQYAMTDFGYAQVDADTLRVGGPVADRVHGHVNQLLEDAHRSAARLLAGHERELRALAEALLRDEDLTGAQVREIVAASTSS